MSGRQVTAKTQAGHGEMGPGSLGSGQASPCFFLLGFPLYNRKDSRIHRA